MSEDEVYRTLLRAIDMWGCDAQLKMVLEEMSELAKEICKFWRGKNNTESIADEVADVEIMLAQAKLIFGIEKTVEQHKVDKLERLKMRLDVFPGPNGE